ncbi:hypothetical protein [Janthinobacterium sp. RT4P48]|uniref:hypothetical protein n=1 Tax=Janthinobacterium sp. RT4P48 TaxID=3424188 RepID=UPI003F24A953
MLALHFTPFTSLYGLLMTRRLFTAVVAGALLLTGCLIPERFNAKAIFQPDGTYSFSYIGTVAQPMAAMQLVRAGTLTAKENESLARETATFQRDPDVKKANYLGNGRYELVLESKRKKGEALNVLGVLKVGTGKDGIITIASGELDKNGKKQLSEMGIKLDGTLEVTLPKNAEVLSHNATSTPSFFGLLGSYSWKIGNIDQRPLMKIRLKT